METKRFHTKMVPPDGGWGWLVVLGSSIMNVATISIGPSFGLLFGGLLKHLGVGTAGASLVVSTLDGIFNFSGLIVGPLLKKFTYRKVAILGALISTAAFLLTAAANSLIHILITYGVLGGIGFSLGNSCTLVGINSYFTKKKGQAVALSMTGTVIGFMLWPQTVRFLLDEYDFRSTLFIIGALSLHAVVGACLFQPVSWHRKAVMEVEEAHTLLTHDKIEIKDSSASTDTKNQVRKNVSSPNIEVKKTVLRIPSQAFSRNKYLISNVSYLDGTENTFHIQRNDNTESENKLEKNIVNSNEEKTEKNSLRNKPKKPFKSGLIRLYKLLDLDILRDGVYWNILFGQSMLVVVETNFKLILPFFLLDLGFTRSQTASVMSSMAISDMCSRIIIPPILDRLTITRRATFMFSTICVALGRSCVAFQRTIGYIMVTLVIIGFFRGVSLTSYPLVLTEYSSGNNFPSVLGWSMVFKGISIAIFGPLSGYIRDVTNSYPLFIHFQTFLMALVLLAWIVEIITLRYKNNKPAIPEDLQIETEDKIPMTNS